MPLSPPSKSSKLIPSPLNPLYTTLKESALSIKDSAPPLSPPLKPQLPPSPTTVKKTTKPTPIDTKLSPKNICMGCSRSFTKRSSIQRHYQRSPACVAWINSNSSTSSADEKSDNDIPPPDALHKLVNTIATEAMSSVNEDSIVCLYCHKTFSNMGNMHKHYTNAVACNRLACKKFMELAIARLSLDSTDLTSEPCVKINV